MSSLNHPLPLSFSFSSPADKARAEELTKNAGACLGVASALPVRSRARAARSQISNPAYHVSRSQAFSLKVLDPGPPFRSLIMSDRVQLGSCTWCLNT